MWDNVYIRGEFLGYYEPNFNIGSSGDEFWIEYIGVTLQPEFEIYTLTFDRSVYLVYLVDENEIRV